MFKRKILYCFVGKCVASISWSCTSLITGHASLARNKKITANKPAHEEEVLFLNQNLASDTCHVKFELLMVS